MEQMKNGGNSEGGSGNNGQRQDGMKTVGVEQGAEMDATGRSELHQVKKVVMLTGTGALSKESEHSVEEG